MSVPAFLARHYDRAALVVKGTGAALYDGARFTERVSLRAVDAARRGANGHEQWRIAADQIDEELARGHTICADVSDADRVAQALVSLASDLGVGSGGFAKLYVSPRGAGFGMHLDRDHVFVIQLEGEKKWEYSTTPAVPHAVQSGALLDGRAIYSGDYAGVPMHGARDVDFAEVVLAKGDVLYLPSGTWHEATTVSERSLAVSLSPPRWTPYELAMQVLDQLALVNPEWHRDLAPGAALPKGQGVFHDELERVTQSIAKALTNVSPATLSRAHLLSTQGSQVVSTGEPQSLSETTVLRARGPLGYLTVDDTVIVVGAGREVVFPLGAESFVAALIAANEFSVEQAGTWHALSLADHLALLTELVSVGLLELA